MIACIRGANTVLNNEREEMLECTKQMLEAIIKENNLNTETKALALSEEEGFPSKLYI